MILALAAAIAAAAPASGPAIAFTFDDMPAHGALPPGTTRVEVGDRIIAALRAGGVPAHGFVNGVQTEREPASAPVLDRWVKAGFPLGNHSWSHPNLDDVTPEQEEAEIARNEPLLARVDPRGDWRWFRYPFLSEGSDPAKRAAVRAVLKRRGYRIAAVTVDFSDWAYNEPYARCVSRNDTSSIRAMQRDWLAAARDRTAASRAVAHALYGRDIPYVLLMHLGGFDALMLPRLIAQYRADGFRFVSLAEAERDPAYAAAVDPGLPAPMPLPEQLTAKGLPQPPARAAPLDLDAICR